METRNRLIKTLEVIKKYFDKKILTEVDMMLLVNDVYNSIIENYRKKLLKSKTIFTIEDYEDISDAIIDLSNILIVSVLRTYSLDTSSAIYELSEDKIRRIKKHLSKCLISKKDDVVVSEILSCLFNFYYFMPIRNAINHRKLILSEKKKKRKS